ncbi:MAG: outer rane efflux protein [Gemmatimonadetes bacterium]|nr:outer rane efflux protein [Gemmatimonadota bacterium]
MIVALAFVGSNAVHAQLPVTRAEAERAALAAGTRVALARADTAAAIARLLTARTLPNPTLAASYTKAVPQKHVTLDIPVFDVLWKRGLVVGQASASVRAARLLFASERLAALVEVDTTYTRALAADARFRLSRQTARDADSLRKMTASRRDAGDASDLDVDLATVVAGQQLNVASDDSVMYMSTLLTVQTLMGIPADSVAIVLSDSLVIVSADTLIERRLLDSTGIALNLPPAIPGTTQASGVSGIPSVAAAEATLRAAELAVGVQKRNTFDLPSINIGAEWGDPTGGEPGLLPIFGFSIPIPIFNRNRGPIAEATAERDRARILVISARLTVRQRLIEGVRERNALIAKVARDRDLVIRAQRVADRSLTAYREGAQGLPAVLEARRSAREVLGQYIDDLAALLTINTELRALTQTVPVP